MSTLNNKEVANTISKEDQTGRNIEKQFQHKIMSKVYFVSFVVLFISAAAMAFIAAMSKTHEFEWVGIVMFIAALPMIQWAFSLFWRQEKNRKARNRAMREQRKNRGSGQ